MLHIASSKEGSYPPNFIWIELKAVMWLAAPVVVQTCSQQALLVTDQIFLGHLGTAELGAAALGNVYFNLLWFFLLGLSTALDTLGAAAHGAGDRAALQSWTGTALLAMTLLSVPLAVILQFGQQAAAGLFHQDAHVAALTGTFCSGLTWGLWPLAWTTILSKYLQAQAVMTAPAVVGVLTFLINIGSNVVLVRALGFSGAPLATSLSRILQLLMTIMAVVLHERHCARQLARGQAGSSLYGHGDSFARDEELVCEADALLASEAAPLALHSRKHEHYPEHEKGMYGGSLGAPPLRKGQGSISKLPQWAKKQPTRYARLAGTDASPSSDALAADSSTNAASHGHWSSACAFMQHAARPSALKQYLALGLPGGFGVAFEASAFEATMIFAGQLGPTATAAHAALLSVVALTYVSGPFALAIAGCIRVGNLLGGGQPEAARAAGIVTVVMGGVFMAVSALVIASTSSVLGRVFSNDPQVVSTMASVAMYAALFQVSDGVMGTSQGVLRGCGHQRLTMVFNFLGFWLGGVVLGYVLCFKAGMGLKGLWLSIASGCTITALLNNGYLWCRVNFHQEAKAAAARALANTPEAGRGMNEGEGDQPHSPWSVIELNSFSEPPRKWPQEHSAQSHDYAQSAVHGIQWSAAAGMRSSAHGNTGHDAAPGLQAGGIQYPLVPDRVLTGSTISRDGLQQLYPAGGSASGSGMTHGSAANSPFGVSDSVMSITGPSLPVSHMPSEAAQASS